MALVDAARGLCYCLDWFKRDSDVAIVNYASLVAFVFLMLVMCSAIALWDMSVMLSSADSIAKSKWTDVFGDCTCIFATAFQVALITFNPQQI
jgi:hypothetical protein